MTMSDFDTCRVSEIAILEGKIKALQEQVSQYKANSDKWTPRVSSELNMGDFGGRVTLHFGGKAITATLSQQYFMTLDESTAVDNVAETLCQSLVIDRLKEVVGPEVVKLMKNAKAMERVGKW
jgi:hypothetical protein